MKRLAAVVVVALAGFVAALLAFDDAARQGCVTEAAVDPSYSAEFHEPVEVGETTHVVTVTRRGEPVSGARVCVNIAMAGMSAMGASAEADEVAPGRYEVALRFDMAGLWAGELLVAEPGGAPAAVPVEVEVTS